MWTVLFPNWESFKYYFFNEKAKEVLNQLITVPLTFKNTKTTPSHKNFSISFGASENPEFFLKAFVPRFFKKNRVKAYLKVIKALKRCKVPLVEPYFLFWKNPQWAYLKKESFYGGVIFPFFSKGFLNFKAFTENPNLLDDLVVFLFSLHQKGVFVRDTKFYNFYHTEEEGFKIFDLDGVKVYSKPLDKKKRLRDLASLAMTLEWRGMNDAVKRIWEVYKRFFPGLTEEDFCFFKKQVEKRREKRIKHLARRENS
ncbi:hypothetical protein F1847_08030 [Thermodesulfobacterium sp. TA1]|uniref:hypothetical protein n=1 Tax=Thermodesulfobacterium sp. TA1 TaxID=2234087 RepID=UPI001231F676|nr:hypothetical protein [Thermodesulfobacterium sp. TA1]QER42690.1 hypothetical protein F1847_08030 [Thermodesulfobacterium sp. TA1]